MNYDAVILDPAWMGARMDADAGAGRLAASLRVAFARIVPRLFEIFLPCTTCFSPAGRLRSVVASITRRRFCRWPRRQNTHTLRVNRGSKPSMAEQNDSFPYKMSAPPLLPSLYSSVVTRNILTHPTAPSNSHSRPHSSLQPHTAPSPSTPNSRRWSAARSRPRSRTHMSWWSSTRRRRTACCAWRSMGSWRVWAWFWA